MSPSSSKCIFEIPDFIAAAAAGFEPLDAADSRPDRRVRAAHVMLFARADEETSRACEGIRALVMMTLRSDGSLGFPGGIVEPGETPAEAAARESYEEVNADRDLRIAESQLLCAHLWRGHEINKEVELYFYAKELTLEDFKKLERSAVDAEMYGTETLGVVRVPLYDVADASSKGLPDFLGNVFAGNAKSQLVFGLYSTNLLSLDEAKKAMEMSAKKDK